MVKTLISGEIEQRNLLEKYLRLCVDDVKAEITKKRGEQKNSYCKLISLSLLFRIDNKMKKGHPDYFDEKEFTNQEKNKIIQVL